MDRFLLKTPSFSGKRKIEAPCQPSSSSRKLVKHSKGEQMFLDIGQKFGATKQCPRCGMLLVISDLDDNKQHLKFCKEVGSLIALPTLKGHQIRAQFDDVDHIIEVSSNHKLHCKQIRSVLDVVMTELGCSEAFLSEEKRTYLYVRKDLSIVGCLVSDDVLMQTTVPLYSADDVSKLSVTCSSEVSRISTTNAENVCSNSSDDVTSTADRSDSSTTSSSNNSDDASRCRTTLGVRLIWVASQCRREGIASRLVDAARQFHQYGRVVQRRCTAFSQPTAEGFAFAMKYGQTDCVLGY